MAAESVLLLPVPKAEAVVGDWRQRYDPAASAGVPAHVTILYPFAPPHLIRAPEMEALSDVFSSFAAWTFRLVEPRRFEEAGALYLAPDSAEAFVELTNAIVHRFPKWPPYGGRFPEVVPHLRVTQGAPGEVLDEVENALEGALPIECEATEVVLMVGNNANAWNMDGRWVLA